MRKMIAKRFAFLFAGAAAVMSPSKTEAQQIEPATTATQTTPSRATHPLRSPIAAERIRAEIEAIEADFYMELDIVNVDQDTYTDAGPNNFDIDGPEGELPAVNIFYTPRIAQLEADLLESFNRAGTFDTRPEQQALDMEAYLPEEEQDANTREVNQILARHIAQSTVSSLVTAAPAGAYAKPMDFDNGRGGHMRVCLTRVVPSHTDEDTFMSTFTGGLNTRGVDVELADMQQYVANHEFAHCLTAQNGMPTWVGETMADAYALTRHMQLNGEDGFADVILNMRRLNAFRAQGGGHNTVPGLERLIPRLRDAYAQGRLDGLSPRQVRDLSFELLLGTNEQEIMAAGAHLDSEYTRQMWDYRFMQAACEIKDGRIVIKEDVPPAVAERLQGSVDQVNASLAYMTRPNAMLDAAEVNSSEAEVDFRDNMDEYIATQESPEIALEGIRARLFSLDNLQRMYVEKEGEEKLPELLEAHGPSKITLARQREIYEGYAQDLEQQIERNQGREPEQEGSSIAMS